MTLPFSVDSELWARLTSGNSPELLLTLVIVVGLLTILRIAARFFRERKIGTAEERRTAYLRTRNGLTAVTMLLLLTIWGGRLQNFALSLAALAAAVAIAGKELFMSLLGSLMRFVERPYSVGDVIEIAGLRGEVIKIDLLTTSLLERGPSSSGTGRTIDFPNMFVLLNPVRKFSHTGRFLHEFVRLPLERQGDVLGERERLLAAGEEVTRPWRDEAERHFRRVGSTELVDLPGSAPLVLIEPINEKQVDLVLRFACPRERRTEISQAILVSYFQHAGVAPALAPTPPPPLAPTEPERT